MHPIPSLQTPNPRQIFIISDTEPPLEIISINSIWRINYKCDCIVFQLTPSNVISLFILYKSIVKSSQRASSKLYMFIIRNFSPSKLLITIHNTIRAESWVNRLSPPIIRHERGFIKALLWTASTIIEHQNKNLVSCCSILYGHPKLVKRGAAQSIAVVLAVWRLLSSAG